VREREISWERLADSRKRKTTNGAALARRSRPKTEQREKKENAERRGPLGMQLGPGVGLGRG